MGEIHLKEREESFGKDSRFFNEDKVKLADPDTILFRLRTGTMVEHIRWWLNQQRPIYANDGVMSPGKDYLERK